MKTNKQMELLKEVQKELLGKDCHKRFTNSDRTTEIITEYINSQIKRS
jgi:hypothetical protein